MRNRTRVWAFSSLAAAFLGTMMLLGAACSAPDPGEIPYRQDPPRPKPNGPVQTITGADGGSGGDDGAVFQQPYTQGTAKLSSTQDKHADIDAAASLQGQKNPAGHSCVDECHSAGKPAATKPFVAGGTVYTDNTGTTPVAAGVEVRIRNPNGQAVSAYTDENGNFFIRQGDFDIAQGAAPGIRDAVNGPMLMVSQLGPGTALGGACGNGPACHQKGGGSLGGVLRVKGP